MKFIVANRGQRTLLQLLVVLVTPTLAWSQITVTLEPVKFPNADVRFEVAAVDNTAPDLSSMSSSTSASGRFKLYVDLTDIRNQSLFYAYDLYVQASGHAQHFKLQASPTGAFDDVVKKVSYQIKDGTTSDSGEISLPLHGRFGRDFLKNNNDTISTVDLVNGATLEVAVTNTSQDMKVVIDPSIGFSEQHAEYWSAIGPRKDPTQPFVLNPGQSQTLVQLDLKPKFWDAFRGSIMPIAKEGGHDVITLSLVQHADFGGPPVSKSLSLPIRFVPSFWSLLTAVLLGALLGSFGSFLFAGDESVKWWHRILAGVLIALLAEVAGVAAMSANSKLVLFGMDIDPRQVLSAFLLGAVTGLGGLRGAQTMRDRWLGGH